MPSLPDEPTEDYLCRDNVDIKITFRIEMLSKYINKLY
jgi:hypothetical protein